MKLFVEGGGDTQRTQRNFRKELSALVEKIAAKMPRIVACGSRNDTLKGFSSALVRGEDALLLVDSEGPVARENFGRPWAHLSKRDSWQRPEGASDAHAHLMAQCMESWFVADPDALASHFGNGFKADKLPQNPQVEDIPKGDVMSGLATAAKETRNGGYDKTRDGFALIGKITPSRVAKRARHAGRFFDALRHKLGAMENK